MEVIHVPAPPKEAFQKLRPISDLIKAQVKHFKHVEAKLSDEQREGIPQHRITTENDAALYIAAMTRFLRSGVATARQTVESAIVASAPNAGKPAMKPRPKPSPKKK